MDQRTIAHLSILSSAISSCGNFLACGTNLGYLFVYSLESFADSKKCDPHIVFCLLHGCGVHCLLTNSNHLFAGMFGRIFTISWDQIISKRTDFKIIQLPFKQTSLELTEVNSLASFGNSDVIYAAGGDGSVFKLSLSDQNLSVSSFGCHSSSIYGLSPAGCGELLSCSEDGRACFWDTRLLCSKSTPSQTFTPGKCANLSRPLLGDWLTVASAEENDCDWFILGGGPKLSLWNRKAVRHTAVLQPESDAQLWYPQACCFTGRDVEPKIVAGGTSSNLLAWDHSGSTLFETLLANDPATKLSHILTITEIVSHSDFLKGYFVVGGVGSAIHVVSPLGYPIKKIGLCASTISA